MAFARSLRLEHKARNLSMLLVEQNMDFVTGFANSFGLMSRGQIVRRVPLPNSNAGMRIDQHLSI